MLCINMVQFLMLFTERCWSKAAKMDGKILPKPAYQAESTESRLKFI